MKDDDTNIVDSDENEFDTFAFNKYRQRFAPKRLKIHGQSLASWAKMISDQDGHRVHSAISIGLTSGLSATDIAHSVIGSRQNNGVEGMTEITRQHILRLGHGYLRRRQTRMSGLGSDGRTK